MESWVSWEVSKRSGVSLGCSTPTTSWPKPIASRTSPKPTSIPISRASRGNPGGGQWTSVGGGGPVRLAQAVPPGEELRERYFRGRQPGTGSAVGGGQCRSARVTKRVPEIDPTWSPRLSLVDPNRVESQIAAAESERDEAVARHRELVRASLEDLVNAFASATTISSAKNSYRIARTPSQSAKPTDCPLSASIPMRQGRSTRPAILLTQLACGRVWWRIAQS